MPELQRALQEILQSYDIARRISVFLEADASSPDACSDAKEKLFQITGLRSRQAPAGLREDMNAQANAGMQFLDLIKVRGSFAQ